MDDDFRSLMRRVREGSEEAAWELVETYGEAIRRAVRRALHEKFRSKFDSMDFVQIVWKSFFRARDKLDRFDRPQDLAAFLIGVARNKVQMESRRLTADRHDVRRERDFDGTHGTDADKVPDPRPAPIDVAIARERWDRMLRGQSADCRRLVQLRLEGYTYEAIGVELHLDKGVVRRVVQQLLHEIPT